MKKFDYSFLKEEIPGSIVGTIGVISDLQEAGAFAA